MTPEPRPQNPVRHDAPARIPDELIDALLDGELDSAAQAKLFRTLRHDLKRCEEVARTRRAISLLREQPPAPDMTDAIMARVAARRPFLPGPLRRLVTVGRLSCAASLLLGVLGVAVAHRVWPDAMRLTPVERPVSEVLRAGEAEATAGVQSLAVAVGQVRERVNEPVIGFQRTDAPEVGGPTWPRSGGADPAGRGSGRQSWLVTTLTPGKMSAVREPNFSGSGGEALIFYTGSGTMASTMPLVYREDFGSPVVMPLGQHATHVRLATTWTPPQAGPLLLPPIQERAPLLAGQAIGIGPTPAEAPSPAADKR